MPANSRWDLIRRLRVNGESCDVTCTYSQQFGVCLYFCNELCHREASTDHLFYLMLDFYIGYKNV